MWSYWSNIYLDHGHVWIWRLFIRIIFIIFRFPGTVCRIVSLNFYRFWVTFLWFLNQIESKWAKIWAKLVKAKQISKMTFFQKPLNWVFGKTLKYRIKKLNTWPGQLEHALLNFRTPLAPNESPFPLSNYFLKFQKNSNFG